MSVSRRSPTEEQKPKLNHSAEKLLAAKDAEITALKKEVASYRTAQVSGSVQSAHRSSATSIKRYSSPPSWKGSNVPVGTRDNPVQICESDEEYVGTVGTSLPSTRPQVRAATRREKIDLGMIELSDSEPEVAIVTATADPSIRRKRRKTTTTHKSPKKEPDAKNDASVLQKPAPAKQRKLNHTDDGGDGKSNTVKKEEHEKTGTKACASPTEQDKLDQVKLEVGGLMNPKAEIKKEFLLKDEDLLELVSRDALKPFPISLAEDKRSVTVTREQLSRRFGGGRMETFPRPNKHRIAVHGRNNFMCISLDWNPHGPQKPGHGGLFFETTVWPGDTWTTNRKHSRTQVLFVKLSPNQWLYLGEYELIAHTPLTAQQWRNLHEKVRSTWASEISTSGWGKPLRANIDLRSTLGRKPTREEVEDALGDFKHVSKDEVRGALDTGEVCICAWSMKCIGYDETFQLELIEISGGG